MLSNTGSRISAFSFPSGPGRKFEKSEKIMRSCLYLFFKKRDRGREKVENSSYHHTDICAFYLHIISHVYLNEETEGKGVRWVTCSESTCWWTANSGFENSRAHMLLTMVLCSKFLWATQQSQKQTNSKIRTLHWSCLFSCLFPTPTLVSEFQEE